MSTYQPEWVSQVPGQQPESWHPRVNKGPEHSLSCSHHHGHRPCALQALTSVALGTAGETNSLCTHAMPQGQGQVSVPPAHSWDSSCMLEVTPGKN